MEVEVEVVLRGDERVVWGAAGHSDNVITEPGWHRRQLSGQLTVMYYYHRHPHNRGIQDNITHSITTIKSIRIQFNEEPGLDNKTSHIKEWFEMLDWLESGWCEKYFSCWNCVFCVAVRSRQGTIIWLIFPWCGGQCVRPRYHYDPYPQYLDCDKIIISTHYTY